MQNNKCSKCGGEIEEGMVADKSYGPFMDKPEWGKKIFFLGTALEDAKDVKTFRCKACGYLESYAK